MDLSNIIKLGLNVVPNTVYHHNNVQDRWKNPPPLEDLLYRLLAHFRSLYIDSGILMSKFAAITSTKIACLIFDNGT
jgi:hypothetical protein